MDTHKQVWQDYTQNWFLGWTLTLSDENGAHLIGALSTAVGLVGSAVWIIAAYSLHQTRANQQPIDAATLERQVIFRNPTTASGDFWQLVQLAWAYKSLAARAIITFLFSLIPFVIFAGFAALGVFVSSLAIPSYQASRILAIPGICGSIKPSTTVPGLLAYGHKISNATIRARGYAQQCYAGGTGPLDCNYLPVRSLKYNTTMATCPWTGDRCALDTGALRMTSDWIDSHTHLGINAKPENRVQVRFINTCSVIKSDDLWISSRDNTTVNDYLLDYYLGSDGVTPYTFRYFKHSSDDLFGYTVTTNFGNADGAGINVTSKLNLPDADLSFMFVAPNSIVYTGLSQDPLFNVSGIVPSIAPGFYKTDLIGQIMVCADQRQFRNPTLPNAPTAYLGSSQLIYQNSWPDLGLNPVQQATLHRISVAMRDADTFSVVFGQDAAALLAASKVLFPTSQALPSNQWELEARGWFETILAKLQYNSVDYITNYWYDPNDPDSNMAITSPAPNATDPVQQALFDQCSNQFVRSQGGFQSFYLGGVVIVASLTVLLIPLSFLLPIIVRAVHKKSLKKNHPKWQAKLRADQAMRKMALLREALQAGGYHDFSANEHDFPFRVGEDINPAQLADGYLVFKAGNGEVNRVNGGGAAAPVPNGHIMHPAEPHAPPQATNRQSAPVDGRRAPTTTTTTTTVTPPRVGARPEEFEMNTHNGVGTVARA